MRKILMAAIAAVICCSAVFASKATPEEKKAGPPVITSAGQIIEELEKRGVSGEEADGGLLSNILKALKLRGFKSIEANGCTMEVYDFQTGDGFNIAVKIFQGITMVTKISVYKSRPYIISFKIKSMEGFGKLTEKLKEVMPYIQDIGAKEY
jgi:hypothetical protein